MNRKMISDALSMIDDTFIEESIIAQSQYSVPSFRRKRYAKKMIALGLAACLIFTIAATVGAVNLLGIRDMFTAGGRDIPEQAAEHITAQTESAHAEDWSCRVTESLCDGNTIITTITVSCTRSYLLAPVDAGANDPAAVIGADSDLTLGEYAAAQGRKLLFIGAAIGDDAPAASPASLQYEHISSADMTILIRSEIEGTAEQAILTVYAVRESGEKEELRLILPLSDTPASDTVIYSPVDPDSVYGLTVGDAVAIETPLGIYISIEQTVTDYDAFARMEMVCSELTGFEGGSVTDGDGKRHLELSFGKGTLTDTLTLQVYDVETHQSIGEIVFIRK